MERVIESVRSSVVFCGHAAAGKSCLIDRLLSITHSVPGDPDAVRRNSLCDSEPEEQFHGHSIDSAITRCFYGDNRFQLLDTPGHGEFIAATIASLYAADLALICVNGHSGIQMNTRRVFDEATRASLPVHAHRPDRSHLPMGIVVTKLDDPQADYATLIERLRQTWGSRVMPVNVPLGRGPSLRGVASVIDLPAEARDAAINLATAHEQLVERLVETDESLMEDYFNGKSPDSATLCRLLQTAVASGHIIPVLAVSTTANVGLTELLDALVVIAPDPYSQANAQPNNGEHQPLVARVFKTRIDPFVQKISYLKIHSGSLSRDQLVVLRDSGKEIRLGQPLAVQGPNLEPVELARAGDIVALGKIEDLHIGTVLGDQPLPDLPFPNPMVTVAVAPLRHGDENKLTASLQKLAEEDPTLRVSRDSQTGELVVSAMSELHLQVLRERMLRRDKIEIETHEPRIAFRETITSSAGGSYRHKKQSGGRGQFGEVHLRIMPLPRGTQIENFVNKARFPQMKSHHYHAAENFLWIDSVVGGSIPGNFMPAVEKGLLDSIHSGVLAGCPIQDIAVEVYDGKHHPVDSSEQAFRTAAAICFRNLFREARPALLEPIARMQITVMDSHVGDIFSDLSGRGGRVLGSESAGQGWQMIECEAPIRVIGHYGRTLSSITAGTGTYALELSHYETVPLDVQQQLVALAKNAEAEV